MKCRNCGKPIKETPWRTSHHYIHATGWFRCEYESSLGPFAQPEEDE